MTPDELDALIRESMPYGATLGIEPVAAGPHEVRARVAWSAERCTGGGLMHGGVLMSLADSTGGVCAFLNLPEGATTSTIESKTNFLRGVREGYAEAVSRPLHAGRTVIVVETDTYDASGRLVAKTVQTQAVLRP